MDPRFMDVLQALTGIDLNAMQNKGGPGGEPGSKSDWEDISGRAQEQ